MIYRDYLGERVSNLALGCMRLPVKESDAEIDMDALQEMVDYAIAHGVNYFDTAWGYHGGNSEKAIGKALSRYPRESYFLADKFPGYSLDNMPKVKTIFPEQLRKCGVEYFDFYLLHNVCERNIDAYLNPEYGILDYLMNAKREGKIRHLGFSCHANPENLKRFLDAYGEYMEFCQLQINYLDWYFQKAKQKVEIVSGFGIPVVVMEPLRGGKLVTIPDEYKEMLDKVTPGRTPIEWAFRFLQTIPEVKVILNGASSLAQLQENIRTFETDEPLDEHEFMTLIRVADAMTGEKTVPCTACRYCTSYCPMELDIPYLISLYNEHIYTGGGFLAPMAVSVLPEEKRPSACLHCGACESVCPQSLPIPKLMEEFAEKLKR